MTPARLWLTVFLAGFAAIAALLAVTLLTPVPYGDLSRTGLLSESAYGWRIDQPHIDPRFLRATPPAQADILVVGDSFSMSYAWQSVLTRAGYRVATMYWGDMGDALCDDFDAWLQRSGFHGRLVIVESVERLLPERLENTRKCRRMHSELRARPDPYHVYPERVPGFALNWRARISSGYITWRNTRKAAKASGPVWSYRSALVRPVPGGCALFSHRDCGKALFFKEDVKKSELRPADVATMQAFAASQRSPAILWMIVPNKTTVYLEPSHGRGFATAFAASGLGPDLFAFAFERKAAMRDFYFPNDTHLSTRGQLAVGERMLESVRPMAPLPPGTPRQP